MRVNLLRGNTGLGEPAGPEFDELLNDLFPLEVQVAWRASRLKPRLISAR